MEGRRKVSGRQPLTKREAQGLMRVADAAWCLVCVLTNPSYTAPVLSESARQTLEFLTDEYQRLSRQRIRDAAAGGGHPWVPPTLMAAYALDPDPEATLKKERDAWRSVALMGASGEMAEVIEARFKRVLEVQHEQV